MAGRSLSSLPLLERILLLSVLERLPLELTHSRKGECPLSQTKFPLDDPRDVERILRLHSARRVAAEKRAQVNSRGQAFASCCVCGKPHLLSAMQRGRADLGGRMKMTIQTGERLIIGAEKEIVRREAETETRIVQPTSVTGWICTDCGVKFPVHAAQIDRRIVRRIKNAGAWNSRQQRLAAEAAELEIHLARKNLELGGMPEWASYYAALESMTGSEPDSGHWAHTGNPDWISWRLIYNQGPYQFPGDALFRAWRRDPDYHWSADPSSDVRGDGVRKKPYWQSIYRSRDPYLRGWEHRPMVQPSGTPETRITWNEREPEIRPTYIDNRPRAAFRPFPRVLIGGPVVTRTRPQRAPRCPTAVPWAIYIGGKLWLRQAELEQ